MTNRIFFNVEKLLFIFIQIDTLEQGCTTQIPWRARNFFWPFPRAKIICFYPFKGYIYQKKHVKSATFWAKGAKLIASAGHIWPAGRMLCMPALELSQL